MSLVTRGLGGCHQLTTGGLGACSLFENKTDGGYDNRFALIYPQRPSEIAIDNEVPEKLYIDSAEQKSGTRTVQIGSKNVPIINTKEPTQKQRANVLQRKFSTLNTLNKIQKEVGVSRKQAQRLIAERATKQAAAEALRQRRYNEATALILIVSEV